MQPTIERLVLYTRDTVYSRFFALHIPRILLMYLVVKVEICLFTEYYLTLKVNVSKKHEFW